MRIPTRRYRTWHYLTSCLASFLIIDFDFDRWCLFLSHSFSVIYDIAVNHISLKHDSLDYIFVFDSVDLATTSLMQLALKYNTFSVITQNNGHYAVQDHSRSPVLVPIESHATSYFGEYTNLHPILHRFQVTANYWSNFRFRLAIGCTSL